MTEQKQPTPAHPLWTSDEVAKAVGGQTDLSGTAISSVTIDSRAIEPGALFVAIDGEVHDGHRFAADAISKGAAAALVHKSVPADGTITCSNTFTGLEDLARASVSRSAALRIAVTGSVGKTGTKELLAAAFTASGACHATKGNLNNHFGLPLTLANMPAQTDTAVLELGMNHAGEIRALTAIAQPEIAIVTAVAAAHSEFFADESEIADAKGEIFEGLTGRKLAILPADSIHTERLTAAAKPHASKIVTFGAGGDAEITSIQMHGSGSQSIQARVFGRTLTWQLKLLGEHWARNSLAVVLALEATGQLDSGLPALMAVEPLPGRGAMTELDGGIRVIDECYNASPAAMTAAIKVAGSLPTDARRVAILGDMLELGETGPAAHDAIVADLIEAKFDLLIGCGPLMAGACKLAGTRGLDAQAFETSAALDPHLQRLIKPNDLVLIKGSLGSKMALSRTRLFELFGGPTET